jgi:hypothetical protein
MKPDEWAEQPEAMDQPETEVHLLPIGGRRLILERWRVGHNTLILSQKHELDRQGTRIVPHHIVAKGRRTELGWSAIRVVDPDGIGEAEIVVYCANCLAREFGGLLLWLTGARAGHSRSS